MHDPLFNRRGPDLHGHYFYVRTDTFVPFLRVHQQESNETMPTRHLLLLSSLILFMACQDPTETEAYRQVEEDRSEAVERAAVKDSTVNALFGTFNRISDNLRTIREKQGLLGAGEGDVELDKDMEQRIMDDLAGIDRLLDENRELIAQLRRSAKANKGTIAELERTVTELERTIAEKDSEISVLKEQLASTNSSLATVIEMYRDKEQLANLQRNELNRAYFAVGTTKELRDNGVLTKEGGVVGLGGVDKLNTTDLNETYFQEVDITKTSEIPLAAKKARVVTSHPEGSYTIEGDGDKLVITNSERFWSVSKYLVVVVD